jgi:integrase
MTGRHRSERVVAFSRNDWSSSIGKGGRHHPVRALILTNSYGRTWTSDGFRTSWSKACAKARVKGLTFHDLRGSAVVRLALAEVTVPQIATFTGHSLKDVEAILDAHYLGRDVQLAEAAVLKLEKRTKL